MTFNLRLSRACKGVVAMRQDSSYYNNWIPRNWGEKGVKKKEKIKKKGKAQYISTLYLLGEDGVFNTGGLISVPGAPIPFGLRPPPTFQRLMDRVLRPHQQYAAAYLDDIYSQGWEEHLTHLQAVLGVLRQAGLTANPTKCKLGFEEVEYLGYLIGQEERQAPGEEGPCGT